MSELNLSGKVRNYSIVERSAVTEAKSYSIRQGEAWVRLGGIAVDICMRIGMALAMIWLFYYLNTQVVSLVRDAFNIDTSLLKDKLIQSDKRLITENVLMSLIGATIVQVGVTLVAITGYLFPKNNGKTSP